MVQREATTNAVAETTQDKWFDRVREVCARSLGVSLARKEELYIEILKSASVRDVSYWLQVFFAAGIATLGLVLNSVAVIIGAMLISPLMGPILASGLALAAGDLVLGIRALLNLVLSCLLAVAFAVLLVGVLPFKEVTAEIAARTQPNTLDLVIALFSGAVGSIAICKEVKGVVTSIPGVAIAVALMPPLCVTGFGLGIALSLHSGDGWRIARGGGLLFLTNLVAITFTAMIVFLLLHIDTPQVKERVREWREHDKTSRKVRSALRRLPGYEQLKSIGSLPARVALVVLLVVLILVPLSQSFGKLKRELALKQRQNLARRTATEIWERNFAQFPDGSPRCYVGNVTTDERNGKLNLFIRVFTGKPYTANEEANYVRQLAARMSVPPDRIALNLVEVPTATSEVQARVEEDETTDATAEEVVPSVADTQAALMRLVAASFDSIRLPAPARMVDYKLVTGVNTPLGVQINYLSPHEISPDAQTLIVEDVRSRLAYLTAQVGFRWIAAERELPAFRRRSATVTDAMEAQLESIAAAMLEHQALNLEIAGGADNNEAIDIAQERIAAVAAIFATRWQIPASRIRQAMRDDAGRGVRLSLELPEENP